MNKLQKLYDKFPFRSAKKFIPLAIENGFTKQEANKFLRDLPRDIKFTTQRNLMLPIYSNHMGAYQMDTLIQTKNASPRYFLIFININSRKMCAYPMKTKDADSVLKCLEHFVTKYNDVQSITSDQDHSYITQAVTDFFIEHHIDHQTTFANDHNRLGIINRAIKTLRDINHDRDFTLKSMNNCLHAYNNSVHSSTGIKPNQFSITDEINYINKMDKTTDEIKGKLVDIKPKTHVRIINDKTIMGKKRSNLSENAYIVDSKVKNKYIIKAKDKTAAEYPRYRLYPDTKAKLASTLGSKRAIIDYIQNYDKRKQKYNVRLSDGTNDSLTIKRIREGHPTKLSSEERLYWSQNKNKGSMPTDFIPYM